MSATAPAQRHDQSREGFIPRSVKIDAQNVICIGAVITEAAHWRRSPASLAAMTVNMARSIGVDVSVDMNVDMASGAVRGRISSGFTV